MLDLAEEPVRRGRGARRRMVLARHRRRQRGRDLLGVLDAADLALEVIDLLDERVVDALVEAFGLGLAGELEQLVGRLTESLLQLVLLGRHREYPIPGGAWRRSALPLGRAEKAWPARDARLRRQPLRAPYSGRGSGQPLTEAISAFASRRRLRRLSSSVRGISRSLPSSAAGSAVALLSSRVCRQLGRGLVMAHRLAHERLAGATQFPPGFLDGR